MDLTKDTKIRFTEAVFTGAYPRAKFSHERTIEGTIIKESYGEKTAQHTFTILVSKCSEDSVKVGTKIRRKGRNVYPNCTVLEYPANHEKLAENKHKRAYWAKKKVERDRGW